MVLIYVNPETREVFDVRIHNFSKDSKLVRVQGSITLNPTDRSYPDKKWVNVEDIFQKVEFSKDFIKNNTF